MKCIVSLSRFAEYTLIREETEKKILNFRSAVRLTFENFMQDFGKSAVCCSF